MFLLFQYSPEMRDEAFKRFTFQYVSIISEHIIYSQLAPLVFTFQYVSIISMEIDVKNGDPI